MPRLRETYDDRSLTAANRRAAAKAVRLVDRLLDRVEELTAAGDDKGSAFAARSAQHLSTVTGIQIDKALLLAGRPTQIHADGRDLDDILKSLNTLVPGLVIDSTAEDVTPQPTLPAPAPSRDPLREAA
jgi:hypothetical protein